MSKERAFTGIWIPKHIWLNDELSPIEKLFLAEIESLSNDEKRGCFASNEYFGNFFKISEGRAANIISALRKRGYINQVFFDGKVRGLRLHENVKAGFTADGLRLHENVKAGFTKRGKQVSRKREHTNIVDNKVDNKEEGAENPLSPPFTKTDLVIGIHDKETPGCVIVDILTLEAEKKETTSPGRGPKTKPEKSGRAKQARIEPTIHPENETAFQHFNNPDKARAAWLQWIKYKFDQFRDRYKSADSELICLRKHWKDTGGDSNTFEKNISHSIGSLYKGIFPPKEEKAKNGQPTNGAYLNVAQRQHLNLAHLTAKYRQAAMDERNGNGTVGGAPTDWEV